MSDIIKGYCILWENILQGNKQIMSCDNEYNVKVCDYKTVQKLNKGLPVSNRIYDELFQCLHVTYQREPLLDEWMIQSLKEYREAYEYYDGDTELRIIDEVLLRLQGKPYPYKLHASVFSIFKAVLCDLGSVTNEQQSLLYNLLKINNQDLRTMLSLSLFWNKRRVSGDVRIVYDTAMNTGFTDDYIGNCTKAKACEMMGYAECLQEYAEKSLRYIKDDNIWALNQYYAQMEGYHLLMHELAQSRAYVDKYHDGLQKNMHKASRRVRIGGMHYLAVTYFMMNDYDMSLQYVLAILEENEADARSIIKLIYCALCRMRGERTQITPPSDYVLASAKGLEKVRIQYLTMVLNDRPIHKQREYLIQKYRPILSSVNRWDEKVITLELKSMRK